MTAPNVITTGHNADGLSIFIDSPEYKVFSPNIGIIYSSDGEPIDLSTDISAYTSRSFAPREHSALIPMHGSTVLVVEWPPSADSLAKSHRTLSVDICVVLNGQIESHLDSGESRLLKQGDVLIQRGTKHAWVNPSSTEPARMLCFVMPCKPVENAKD